MATVAGVLAEWPAMGTTARLRLHDPDAPAIDEVRELVERLEQQWSRFRPDSEVSRINDLAGRGPTVVSRGTVALTADAVAWWRATGGRFDPTVLPALVDAGYDRDRRLGHGPIGSGRAVPGCEGIETDLVASTVSLPAGVAIDLGGIGKGRTVDTVVEALGHLRGGMMELGGDLRVWGEPLDGGGWPVAVADPRDGSTLAVVGLLDGAVATSTTVLRQWSDGAQTAHHLIDPSTGRAAVSRLASVTVVAGSVTGAEVLAKSALVAGNEWAATDLLVAHGVAALLVPTSGAPRAVGGFLDLCWTRSEVVS